MSSPAAGSWHLPESEEETCGLLRGRPSGPAPLVTGAPPPGPDVPGPELPVADALEACDAPVLSTASLAGVHEYRPHDLTVTVGAGTRMADVHSAAAGHGQWLPLSADAALSSAGGVVAAAPPSPWETSFGALRRQVLACRVVSHAGRPYGWGRAVVKNVAGYDLPRLLCGSFGRLGVLTRVTFRTWPAPAVRRRFFLRPPGGSPPEATMEALLAVPAREAFEPDAAEWRWSGPAPALSGREGNAPGAPGAEASPSPPRLCLEFVGSRASVSARAERMEEWAGRRGLRLEAAAEEEGPAAGRPGGAGKPGTSPSLRRRETVVHLAARPRHVPEAARRLRKAEAPPAAVAARPREGRLRARFALGADDDHSGAVALLEEVAAGAEGCAVSVERGPPALHEWAAGRRTDGRRRLEKRVIEALEGRARHWLADYL